MSDSPVLRKRLSSSSSASNIGAARRQVSHWFSPTAPPSPGSLRNCSSSPPSSPTVPINKWMAEATQRRADETGIDPNKPMAQCTRDASYGCLCIDAGETCIKRLVAEKRTELNAAGFVRVHVPACCSERFLAAILAAVPRVRVTYLHIDSGDRTTCRATNKCPRQHALFIALR